MDENTHYRERQYLELRQRPQTKYVAVICSLIVSCCHLTTSGCGYGSVNPQTYACATALYSICNRRAVNEFDRFVQLVEAQATSGAISAQERDWLCDIVEDARQEKWERASRACRKLLEAQASKARTASTTWSSCPSTLTRFHTLATLPC